MISVETLDVEVERMKNTYAAPPVKECWMCHRNEEQVKGAVDWVDFLNKASVGKFEWNIPVDEFPNLVICPVCAEIIYAIADYCAG